MRGAWQFIRVEPLMVNGKAMSTDWKEVNAFTKQFSKVNEVPQDPVADPKMRRLRKALEPRPTASKRTFEGKFTEIELDAALRKGKTGKAPGLDVVTTLHSYPDQGNPIPYSASSERLSQGSALSCTLFLIFMNKGQEERNMPPRSESLFPKNLPSTVESMHTRTALRPRADGWDRSYRICIL
ncbi:hypothetical protein PoB_000424400 [Plakobranchus ocellatus]|uniref:Uncharacterized protein n=1 Tax=Plakobranchus ocellatus TaxID=259542 RepID=A0AAV3Y6M7_9GAST|nr:hypothetical protein PoB_000424400 [Plakobranchus ocellatus]